MDLDSDGDVDILSGSYSRTGDGGMAGLFHVLRSDGKGGFAQAATVLGTDGDPLIVEPDPDTNDAITEKICTRPFAADIDGDGHLDILTGNFGGTFAWFRGTGAGQFSPECEYLTDAEGELLRVPYHSDPFLVDWDRDGDLDLVTGSDMGGVRLFVNSGSVSAPRFDKSVQLVDVPQASAAGVVLGLPAARAPKSAMRVFVADVNGDGKHDLLVGDNVQYMVAAEGLDEAEALTRYIVWQARYEELILRQLDLQGEVASDPTAQAQLEETQSSIRVHYEKQAKIVKYRGTGFVWLYLGK